jgi:hypothetical protein
MALCSTLAGDCPEAGVIVSPGGLLRLRES